MISLPREQTNHTECSPAGRNSDWLCDLTMLISDSLQKVVFLYLCINIFVILILIGFDAGVVSKERLDVLHKTCQDLEYCKDVLKSTILHHSKWKELFNMPNAKSSYSKRCDLLSGTNKSI